MRDLPTIIERMFFYIPDDQFGVLKLKLIDLHGSALYAPPESVHLYWNEVSEALSEEIPDPIEPWQKQIADLFMGKGRFEVKE